MTSIKRQAEKDAEEWTKAKLAIGEGAGNRRKLINETVAFKMQNINGYADAFSDAADKQDVASMAKNAKRDDRRKKVNAAVVRNTKALATGKVENASTIVLLAGAAIVVLHKTGADKKIIDFTKSKYVQIKRRIRKVATDTTKAHKPSRDGVYNITDFR